ncbi:MAG: hypothetical protein OEX18_10860 [Candidatus Krumholzibacteria bacterium]|nr:hypothetical protein [Candidatus Krumholzibacteria bacterium]MDH4337759.1 hypothetical protein [Candidatus Krumholzibacteria bacterium]MDH5271373.1 hypothetical protein [Candidatus Krumholzibacteria bacterium]
MAGFTEIIVRGDDRDLVPYVTGFAAGAGLTEIYFAHEAGLRLKALRERIKHHGEVQHIICTDKNVAKLRKAIEGAAPRYKFEVVEESKLERAYLHFEFDTPSRKVADEIKKVFAALPDGVAVLDFEPEEVVHPNAKGTEAYSPAHEYTFRGKGVVEGDVGGVIETRMRLDDLEFVHPDEIDLHRT